MNNLVQIYVLLIFRRRQRKSMDVKLLSVEVPTSSCICLPL